MGSKELFSAIAEAKENETEQERLARLRNISTGILAREDTDKVTLRSSDFPAKPEQEARLSIIHGSLIEESSNHFDSDIVLQYFPSPQDTPTQITRYLMIGFMDTEDGIQLVSTRVINQLDKDHAPHLSDAPTARDLDEIELMLVDPTCKISEKNPTHTEIAQQKRVNGERKEQRIIDSTIERLKRVREMLDLLQAS